MKNQKNEKDDGGEEKPQVTHDHPRAAAASAVNDAAAIAAAPGESAARFEIGTPNQFFNGKRGERIKTLVAGKEVPAFPGVIFKNGRGFTDDEQAADFCRSLHYEVIDHRKPAAKTAQPVIAPKVLPAVQ